MCHIICYLPGNKIASLVHRLRLDRGHVILRLPNLFLDQSDSSDADSDEEGSTKSGSDEGDRDESGIDEAHNKQQQQQQEHGAHDINTASTDLPPPPTKPAPVVAVKLTKADRKAKQQQQRQDITQEPFVDIELDISESAYANARKMFQVSFMCISSY